MNVEIPTLTESEFERTLRQTVLETDNIELGFGANPFVVLENIGGNCVDNMQQRHLDSKKVIVISHMGFDRVWDSYRKDFQDSLANMRRLFIEKNVIPQNVPQDIDMNLIRTIYFDTPDRHTALRDEFLLEELLDVAKEGDIPVILTIPTVVRYPVLEDDNLMQEVLRDTSGDIEECNKDERFRLQYHTIGAPLWFPQYIKSQIEGRDNVYLLPTLTDDIAEGAEGISGSILGDAKGRNLIHNEQACFSWLDALSRDPLVSGLMRNIADNNSWEKVYFAGGQVENCLRSTMRYFTLAKTVSQISLLSRYCSLEIENDSRRKLTKADKSHIFNNTGVFLGRGDEEEKGKMIEIFSKLFKRASVREQGIRTFKQVSHTLNLSGYDRSISFGFYEGRAKEIF